MEYEYIIEFDRQYFEVDGHYIETETPYHFQIIYRCTEDSGTLILDKQKKMFTGCKNGIIKALLENDCHKNESWYKPLPVKELALIVSNNYGARTISTEICNIKMEFSKITAFKYFDKAINKQKSINLDMVNLLTKLDNRGHYFNANVHKSSEFEYEVPSKKTSPERLEMQELFFETEKGSIYAFNTLCSSKNKSYERKTFFDSISPNKKFSKLLLVNEGGGGKTNFLEYIERIDGEKIFYRKVLISLSFVLTNAAASPIAPYEYSWNKGYIFREVFRKLKESYLKTRQYLFMLDGYNDLLDCNCARNHEYIETIRNEINCIAKKCKNISLIVATRRVSMEPEGFFICRLSNIKESRHQSLAKISKLQFSESISNLLQLPLYFNLFSKKVNEEIFIDKGGKLNTKYDLLERLHVSVYSQTTNNKGITDKSFYQFIYFVFLPTIARKMAIDHKDEVSPAFIYRLYRELANKRCYASRIITNVIRESVTKLTLPDTSDMIIEYITNRFELRNQKLKENFSFMDLEILEYFAAFSIVNDIQTMRTAYINGEIFDYSFDFDLQNINIKKRVAEKFNNVTELEKMFDFHSDHISPKEDISDDEYITYIENEIHLVSKIKDQKIET